MTFPRVSYQNITNTSWLNRTATRTPPPRSVEERDTPMSKILLCPQQMRVAKFTSTQHQCDLYQHSTMIGKGHLPLSNQPSHFLPQPAFSIFGLPFFLWPANSKMTQNSTIPIKHHFITSFTGLLTHCIPRHEQHTACTKHAPNKLTNQSIVLQKTYVKRKHWQYYEKNRQLEIATDKRSHSDQHC